MSEYQDFYNNKYASGEYGMNYDSVEEKPLYSVLRQFIAKYNINEKKARCLEIGSGKGDFQDMVIDYTGFDYSQTVGEYYHKPFIAGSAMEMPFKDNEFEYMWSRAVWEHIPDPERALMEAMRVMKKGGVFLFAPAWHCRPWAAGGYQVRPYSDFNIWGKLYKLLIPVLNYKPYRMMKMFVKRIAWGVLYMITPKNKFRLPYKKLKANYDVFWQADSDACCELDQFLTILWIKSKGYSIPSHPSALECFLCNSVAIEIQK